MKWVLILLMALAVSGCVKIPETDFEYINIPKETK